MTNKNNNTRQMSKDDFKFIFCYRIKTHTFKADGVTISHDLAISNKNYRKGEVFSYTGKDYYTKTIDYAWRHAKIEGGFTMGEDYYPLN